MKFVDWLFSPKTPAPAKEKATHGHWLAEEEERQLAEVRERLERVELELQRIKGATMRGG